MDAFSHVRHWVFDLDNTLYHPSARLFDQIEARMTAWVADALGVSATEANRLRAAYWASHGTTLAGLMEVHGVDPGPYLTDVHDISLDHLEADRALADAIDRLPGRKIVYTNGTAPYAARVVAARGLDGRFDAIYGVEEANYQPKPRAQAFTRIFELDGIDPSQGAMFEDDPRNLAVPHDLGMATILVSDAAPEDPTPHIHHHTDDLAGFLQRIVAVDSPGHGAT